MDIDSKITITLSVADMEQIMTDSIVSLLIDKYGMRITADQVAKIRFNATLSYGQMDRGPGTPTFTGATVEIIQPPNKGSGYETR